MSIETDLRSFLAATVLQAVDGVFYGAVPQRQPITTGLIVFQRISTGPRYALDGSAKIAEVGFQVDCWGRTMDDVDALAQGVRDAVEAYTGMMGATYVHAVFVEGMRDIDEPELPDFERRVLDLAVWHQEA